MSIERVDVGSRMSQMVIHGEPSIWPARWRATPAASR